MITINSVKDYFRCNSCLCDDEIKNISYGESQSNLTSFRLCKKCRNLLVSLLENESEENK